MPCVCQEFEWPSTIFQSPHHMLCAYDVLSPGDVGALMLHIDAVFPDQRDVTSGPLAGQGTPLVTLSLGGLVPEGASPRLVASNQSAAVDSFWQAFKAYARATTDGQLLGTVLYWRERPDLRAWQDVEMTYVQHVIGSVFSSPQVPAKERFIIAARLAIVRK
jgi:hypothetical protein